MSLCVQSKCYGGQQVGAVQVNLTPQDSGKRYNGAVTRMGVRFRGGVTEASK